MMTLTPSDLDAIRQLVREELDAHGRETVPPEEPEAKQPGDLVGPDDVDAGDVVREHHSDGTIDIRLRRRRDAGAWSGVAVAGTGAYLGTTSACMAFFGLYTSTTLVSRAPAEQPATHEAQRQSWARGEMAMGSDADEAAERAEFVAEQPEWETVLGSELREGDKVQNAAVTGDCAARYVAWLDGAPHLANDGDLWLVSPTGALLGGIVATCSYTRRVRPKRPEWATQQSDATWLRSRIDNPALLIQGGPYRTDGVAGELIRRLLPHVEAKARAMLAEVEASR